MPKATHSQGYETTPPTSLTDTVYDVESELKKLENSLRDFIEYVLRQKYSSGWMNNLKISSERIAKWKDRLKWKPSD